MNELEQRFIQTPVHGINLLQLLPSECCKQQPDVPIPKEIFEAVCFYEQDLPSVAMFPTEYRMWVRKWKMDDCVVPVKLIDAFCACHSMTFPNLHVLLQLALTLPITSCESERSFSQLKLIKTSCRSTTTSQRLSGLALMKINRAYCEKLHNSSIMKDLIKEFHQLHPRRMKLGFMLVD